MQVRLVKTYCKPQAENYRVFFEFCKPFMVPLFNNIFIFSYPSSVFSSHEKPACCYEGKKQLDMLSVTSPTTFPGIPASEPRIDSCR